MTELEKYVEEQAAKEEKQKAAQEEYVQGVTKEQVVAAADIVRKVTDDYANEIY